MKMSCIVTYFLDHDIFFVQRKTGVLKSFFFKRINVEEGFLNPGNLEKKILPSKFDG